MRAINIKNILNRFKSLYAQIVVFTIISIIIGFFTFIVIQFFGEYILRNTNLVNQSIQEKLDASFYSLKEHVLKYEEDTYAHLEEWSYQNKYYIVYIMNEDGTIFYTNDGLYAVGDIDVSFPAEKLFTTTIEGEEMNVAITYLAVAEMSANLKVTSIMISFIIAGIVFVLLFKNIIERIKKVSTQLEIVAGGDTNIEFIDSKEDEIGIMVKNINSMKDSILNQFDQINKLETDQYQRIASLSHDIKTPLTVILGYLEIMKGMDVEPQVQLYLNKFELKINEIEHLSKELFENLMDDDKKNKTLKEGSLSSEEIMHYLLEFKENLKLSNFKVKLWALAEDEKQCRINISSDDLKQILTAIHSNLINYANNEDYITIKFKHIDNNLYIKITNKLRYPNDDMQLGSGVGLQLLKSIINQINGNLTYKIEKDKFIFLLVFPTV